MRLTRACSRHCSFTGQVAQIRRAISTPTPSLGKNVLGGSWAQLPRAIHSVSMCPPVPACLLIRNREGFGSRELGCVRIVDASGSSLNVPGAGGASHPAATLASHV